MCPYIYTIFGHKTQDSPISPLIFGSEMGPYIDQGKSKRRVRIYLNTYLFNEYELLSIRGEVSLDLDETLGKFFLRASRSFLYSSGTSETTRIP